MRLAISRRHDFGSAAAVVAICLGVYAIFAVGFHSLIPPTRIQSHAVAAYDPPPKAVVDYPSRRLDHPRDRVECDPFR